ncbi:hypothetical protein [Aquimarina sp. 2304DJ70-9]|uniref:hypothetical protein n=1 Tax=Aquimarina penaris TaxID=3231044 RepID=UPI0034628E94
MKHNTASSYDISEWKGQDIITFQEDLKDRTKTSISEKSFYSYFKNSSKKLPRIDILSILSQYCGYTNWNDFKTKHSSADLAKKSYEIPKWLWFISIGSLLLGILYFLIPVKHTFTFCFIDQDRNQPITKIPIDIIILNNRESPFHTKSDSTGCFSWKTSDDYINFVVQSPYHKTDTIYRIATAQSPERLQIQTDDYALMLHYYANGKVEDWKNRRKELSKIIADDVTIFQVLPYGLGIEMYTKENFINTLTTPTQSLKNIEIIESRRLNGQIVKLKFRVRS